MAIQTQWRRGATAQNDAFTGALGEITVDTERNELRLHDGFTAGGHRIAQAGDYLLRDGSAAMTDALDMAGHGVTDVASVNGGPLSARRNLLMNADGLVHQRGDFVSGLSSGYGGPDRWKVNAAGGGVFNVASNADAPAGHRGRSLSLQATTAVTPGTANYVILQQVLEGRFLQHLDFGTANARPLALSFWVKASVSGTYTVELFNSDPVGSRHSAKSFTVNASGVWEFKTLQFPGDTAAGFDVDNGDSFSIGWWLAAGSNFTGGTLAEAWQGLDQPDRVAAGNANAFGTVGNAFQIFRPQLEPGTVATPFEHVPYNLNFMECQRYYQRLAVLLGANAWPAAALGYALPTPMRASPTLTMAPSSGSGGAYTYLTTTGSSVASVYQSAGHSEAASGTLTLDAEL